MNSQIINILAQLKTASLNRRSGIVFVILFASLYYITMDQSNSNAEIFTDIGNF